MASAKKPAGYSGTPLPAKLGIKAGHALALLNAPEGLRDTLGELPENLSIRSKIAGPPADVALLFVRSRAELEAQFGGVTRGLKTEGAIWVAWPKKSSGVATDLTENVLREVCLPTGYVDTKVCAIDAMWSGLKLVLRVKHR